MHMMHDVCIYMYMYMYVYIYMYYMYMYVLYCVQLSVCKLHILR